VGRRNDPSCDRDAAGDLGRGSSGYEFRDVSVRADVEVERYSASSANRRTVGVLLGTPVADSPPLRTHPPIEVHMTAEPALRHPHLTRGRHARGLVATV
jgi:hypothetical protein